MPAKPPLERAARALCSLQGLPENTRFEGRPMWESFLPTAKAVLQAIREPSEAMDKAAAECDSSLVADVYRAMIDAAVEEGGGTRRNQP